MREFSFERGQDLLWDIVFGIGVGWVIWQGAGYLL